MLEQESEELNKGVNKSNQSMSDQSGLIDELSKGDIHGGDGTNGHVADQIDVGNLNSKNLDYMVGSEFDNEIFDAASAKEALEKFKEEKENKKRNAQSHIKQISPRELYHELKDMIIPESVIDLNIRNYRDNFKRLKVSPSSRQMRRYKINKLLKSED